MQQISGLRSLHALQILFHNSRGVSAASLVREMRHSIADTLMHCPLPVEYLGVCYAMNVPSSDYVTWLKRTGHKPHAAPQTAPWSKTWVDLKGKVRVGEVRELNRRVGAMQELLAEWAVEDSDEELENWRASLPIMKTEVKMSDVVGVKMWEREVWGMRL